MILYKNYVARQAANEENSNSNFFFFSLFRRNHPKKKRRRVPPHPNIIEIKGAYIDDMQRFDGCMSEYPDSLPSRLFRNGLGRNKTMYIVMDKYVFIIFISSPVSFEFYYLKCCI